MVNHYSISRFQEGKVREIHGNFSEEAATRVLKNPCAAVALAVEWGRGDGR